MATSPPPAPVPEQAPAPGVEPVNPVDQLMADDPVDDAPAPRATTAVRVLRISPIGPIGTERDDLPSDWLAEPIARGDVEVID